MRGIYAITNVLTDTVYYGQSVNIGYRLTKHILQLNKNLHKNPHLQASWNKYGKDSFVFIPIQIVEDKNISLTSIEANYIKNAYGLGLKIFNCNDPIEPPLFSEERKKKISERSKGNKNTLGYKHSKEAKAKISAYHKGKKRKEFTVETRRKMSVAKQQYWLNKKRDTSGLTTTSIDTLPRICNKCNNKKTPDEFRKHHRVCYFCEKLYSRSHYRAKKVGSYTPKPVDVEWVDD